jgi:hypothetical protein
MEEKEGTICILKTHPRPKEDAPPSCLRTKDLSEALAAVIISHPTPCIIIGGELLLMSKGDFWFCIQYAAKIR